MVRTLETAAKWKQLWHLVFLCCWFCWFWMLQVWDAVIHRVAQVRYSFFWTTCMILMQCRSPPTAGQGVLQASLCCSDFDAENFRWEQQVRSKVFELGVAWSTNDELKELMQNNGANRVESQQICALCHSIHEWFEISKCLLLVSRHMAECAGRTGGNRG